MDRIIVALTGDSSKGKGTVAKNYKSKGAEVFVLSDIIATEAKKMGWPHWDRKVLQDLGDELRRQFGNDVLVARTFKLEDFKMAEFAVIDGIRHPDEIQLLKDVFPEAKLIAVDMSDLHAFELMQLRNRDGDPKTFEEYMLSKKRERGEAGSNAMQVDKCIELADFKIWNEGDEIELSRKADEALHYLGVEIQPGGIEHHHHHGHEHH